MAAPSGDGGGVALFAHIGGFVFGWVAARRLVDRAEAGGGQRAPQWWQRAGSGDGDGVIDRKTR